MVGLKNNKITGIMAIVGAEVVTALLVWCGLLLAGEAPAGHLRWFAACFIAPALLLRFFAKKEGHVKALKSAIVTLFVTFLIFMIVIFKTNSLSL